VAITIPEVVAVAVCSSFWWWFKQ